MTHLMVWSRAIMPRAVLALGVALAAIPSARGQDAIATRVSGAPDGEVRLSFASRAGVCGDGRDVTAFGRTLYVWPSMESYGTWSGVRCVPGPVRVALSVREGAVVTVRTRVGGTWSDGSGSVTDLGAVGAQEASSYLIGLAERLEGRASKDALLPAVLADSTNVYPALLRIARADSRPAETRKRAVLWLAQSDAPVDREAVRSLVDGANADIAIRRAAIFALGNTSSATDADVAFLREVFGRERSDRVKEAILQAVSSAEDAAGARWLLSVGSDSGESTQVRKMALFWAGQGHASTRDLVAVYDGLTEPALKEHMIFVLSQRDDTAAIDKLFVIARADGPGADSRMRKKALFWLTQKDDPRVVRMITELVNR